MGVIVTRRTFLTGAGQWRRLAGALLLALLVCMTGRSAPRAAQGEAPADTVPDLSSGWLRLDTAGSGSFDGTANDYPPAALTAAGQAMEVPRNRRNVIPADAATRPAHEAGEAYIVNTGECTPEGTGGSGINPNSTAFFILQSEDEVLLVREGPGGRRIHLNERGHPDLTTRMPTLYGHSIGRYEGGALVVETVGLSEGSVPGGGRRRLETRLTERFQLSPDGQRLAITYTWDDPVLYVRAYTYRLFFERLPPGSYAFETWCDSSDPLQRQSIVPPEQLP